MNPSHPPTSRIRSVRARFLLVASLTASLTLAACGGDDESGSTAAPATDAPATDAPGTEAPGTEAPADSALPPESSALPPAAEGGELTIQDFTFSALTVAAGAAFSISNLDGFAHTVTSDTFDVRVDGGATETLTIDTPGTYSIVCKIHPTMQGTIVVE